MKKDKTFDWKALEAKLILGLQQEQGEIRLVDTPFYPLALYAEMPEHIGFANGHLSFRFKDFVLNTLQDLTLDAAACKHEGNRMDIAIKLRQLGLQAQYEINTKYAHKPGMDTGGNMSQLDEQSARVAGAGASLTGDVSPLSPDEVDAMVGQARDQRTSIQGTVHGPSLLSTYNTHSESYNSAFVTSANLRTLWAASGATTQMSRDTHDALNNNAVVNSPTKIYANNLTYNLTAANQQANVAIALKMMSIQAKREGNDALAAKYSDAAIASASFKETVNTTGTDGKQPGNMTGDQVYGQLNDQNARMIKLSEEEFNNMLDQSIEEDPNGGGADAEALRNGWRILHNDERRMIREKMFLFEEELLALKDIQPEVLWSGDCRAALNNTEAQLTMMYDEQAAAWNVTEAKVMLPAFALELDDASWTGKIADVVRERLANVHFVKSLLQNKIQNILQETFGKVAIQALA